ncbi:hypothetical protein GCM10027275_21040 [Rhabdobacter roseus]|uniref:Parallel beta-helix repeat protein n=1 Tax=Rhabdobacter roseus TaxID=1655419 RepID=A0A840TVA8_9BACT|nr:right-handed parallel beta-helix repeat-containing protein [Rhabdobacter roseus]MBB5284038.1 parallel beta-helix repeat protein [Rhabdobacter roseus]
MKSFFLYLSWLWLGLAASAFSQQLYVAPTGSDQNPGTAERPLATLQGARDKARQLRRASAPARPIEVVVRAGTYWMAEPLRLTTEDSGTEASPLVFRGEGSEAPVFYGGMSIGTFEKISDSLWKADVPEVRRYGWRFEQLYVNGQRATRAQTEGFFQPRRVTETVLDSARIYRADLAVQRIALPPESTRWLAGLSPAELHDVVITFYHNWDNTRKYIAGFSAADTALYVVGEGMKPWNKINAKSLFVFENLKAALDAPGEWYLERSGTLYYRPRPGERPDQMTALAPLNEKFVIIAGDEKTGKRVQHLRFENLSFQVASYQMPATGVDPTQAAAPIEAAIQLDFADHVSFVNCEVAHTGGSGIWFRRACANGRVERCYLHDLGASGVKIGETTLRPKADEISHHIAVDNNIVRSGGHVFPCAVALIIFHGHDNELTHNEVADFRYSGVSVGWIWGYKHSPSKRNRVAYNHIHHLGWGVLSDMGGVYTLGPSEGTVVNNNVIHHVYSFDYGGWGLYTDEGSTGVVMENNLVYQCKNSGFHQHYGKENLIRNNIFANNLRAQLQATRVEEHQSFAFTNNIVYYGSGTLLLNKWYQINLASDQNLYWDTRPGAQVLFNKQTLAEWQAAGKDKNSVVADPGFANPAAFDFTIKNPKVLRKINFKPFDYQQAGVYGSDAWKKKAAFDPALATAFDRIVQQRESSGK